MKFKNLLYFKSGKKEFSAMITDDTIKLIMINNKHANNNASIDFLNRKQPTFLDLYHIT